MKSPKTKAYEEIFRRTKDGAESAASVCEELGIKQNSYSGWKRIYKPNHVTARKGVKKRSKVETVVIPEKKEQKKEPKKEKKELSVVMLKGDPDSIAEAMKNMF